MKQLLLLISLVIVSQNTYAQSIEIHSAFSTASDLLVEEAREKAIRLALTMHKTRVAEEKITLHAGKFLENDFSDYFGTYATRIVGGNRTFEVTCQISAHIYKTFLSKVTPSQATIIDPFFEEFDTFGNVSQMMTLAKTSVTCKLK